MQVYFDNTASTPIDVEVLDVMVQQMKEIYGNPSSVHHQGRKARNLIENGRRKIASYFNVNPD